jgi:hypothetical protein
MPCQLSSLGSSLVHPILVLQCIEFVKGDVHLSKAVPPRFKEHTKLVCARHTRSGRKKYVKKHPERQRKVPSRKVLLHLHSCHVCLITTLRQLEGVGCPASISFKTYHGTDEIRASYNPQHSHEIGEANLPFTRRGRRAIVAAGQQAKKRRSSTVAPNGPINGDLSVNDGVADASGSTNDEDDASADGEDGLQTSTSQHVPFTPGPTLQNGNIHHHQSSQQHTHHLQTQPSSPTRPSQASGTPPAPPMASPSISRPRASTKNPNSHHHSHPPNPNHNQIQNQTHTQSHAQNHSQNPAHDHTHQMQQSTSLPPLATHPMQNMQLQSHLPPQSQPLQPHQPLPPQSVLAPQSMLPPQPPPVHAPHHAPPPPPTQQPVSIAGDTYRWERIGALFDSVRHSAHTVMFAQEDVLALEMIILRLHMQTPVSIVAPSSQQQTTPASMISPRHQQSPVGHHVHIPTGTALAGPSMTVNGPSNPSPSHNAVRR